MCFIRQKTVNILYLIIISAAFLTVSSCSNSKTLTDDEFADVDGGIEAEALTDIDHLTESIVFSPEQGVYVSDIEITLSCNGEETEIRYTTDGSDPHIGSLKYSNPLALKGSGSSMLVKAIAFRDGKQISPINSATYLINYDRTPSPSFNPEGGIYGSDIVVAITSSDPDAEIRYTTDGSLPFVGSKVYIDPIPIIGHGTELTIRAIAVKAGVEPSAPSSAFFKIDYSRMKAPSVFPEAGIYDKDIAISLVSDDVGAEIRYTLDGSQPHIDSLLYSTPINLTGDGNEITVRAIAIRSGKNISEAISASYIVRYSKLSAPGILPDSGSYSDDIAVAISSDAGAEIRYTLDGSDPYSGSLKYTDPILITGNKTVATVKAIAIKQGMKNSDVVAGSYIISYEPLQPPEMNPKGGTYSTDISIAISNADKNAEIRYTLDGSQPQVDSFLYTEPISLAGDGNEITVRAIAIRSGKSISEAISGSYIIQYSKLPPPVIQPDSGSYSDDIAIIFSCESGAEVRYTLDGSDPHPGSLKYSDPILIFGDGTLATVKAIAVKDGMKISDVVAGSYIINYPSLQPPEFNPPGGSYSTDITVSISNIDKDSEIRYTLDGSEPHTGSYLYTEPLKIFGDGMLRTIKAIAVRNGYKTSLSGNSIYYINYPLLQAPTMSPAGGEYHAPIEITMESPEGANIYYTLDGSEPDSTAFLYDGPIAAQPDASYKFRAKAMADGYKDSPVVATSFLLTKEVFHAPWWPRDSAGIVEHNGYLWLLGGFGDVERRTNEIWRTPDGVTWEQVNAKSRWNPRNLPCAVTFNGRMWVIGGAGVPDGVTYNDAWSSEDGINWVKETTTAPWASRASFGCTVYDGAIWIMGGMAFENDGSMTYYNDVWKTTDGSTWTEATSAAAWDARSMFRVLNFGGHMWLIGGGVYDTDINHNDVWSSNNGTDWTQVTGDAAFPRRRFHAAVTFSSRMWIMGGIYHQTNSQNLNDVWYSYDGSSWYEAVNEASWAKRHEPMVAVFDSRVWLMGGIGFENKPLNDVWFTINGDDWIIPE